MNKSMETIKVQTGKYSMATLKAMNPAYETLHGLTQGDVGMANAYVELIEGTRSTMTPKVGDRVVYVTRRGDYYGNALIEKTTGREASICEAPYVPFIWPEGNGIELSVSGGAFHSVDAGKLVFKGWTDGLFCDWGHCGACENGAVRFSARVPLWYYAEPEPLYGGLTTETMKRYYLTMDENPENRYLYRSFDGIAFRTEEELREFMDDREGRMFPGNWINQIVVWCFRHEYKFLPEDEWNKVDAPIVERDFNLHMERVKIVKDMKKHITVFYRIDKNKFRRLNHEDESM